MATAAVEEASWIPQVYPGTMLRVEEGQECALLCAAGSDLGGGSRPAAGGFPCRRHVAVSNSNSSSRTSPAGGCGAAAATAAYGAAASASPAVKATVAAPPAAAGPHDPVADGVFGMGFEEDEYLDNEYEGDFAEGTACTATGTANTAGDGGGSSTSDETETFCELSDPGGTEVVFVREGVAVWPGPRYPRIPGRLPLVKQCNVLFMAWLPYSRGVLQEDGTFRVAAAAAVAAATATVTAVPPPPALPSQGGGGGPGTAGYGRTRGGRADADAEVVPRRGGDCTLYAVHPIPLSEVRALRCRSPPLGLGSPSLVLVLTSGVTLPPLYFTRGGVHSLIAELKQHAFLLRCADEPHTYLVNDTADPLSRSLTALQLADVLIGGPPPGASATFKPGEGVVATPAPAAAAAAAWVAPTSGLGLAVAAGLGGSGGALSGGSCAGGGGGLGQGLGLGLSPGSAVSWCWADQPATAAATAMCTSSNITTAGTGLAGFEAVESSGGGEGDGEEGDSDDDDAGSRGSGRGRQAWAYGIVDAINRFVQNVRGTASGWIGALDDLDDEDDGLYDGHGLYAGLPYDDTESSAATAAAAASTRRRGAAGSPHGNSIPTIIGVCNAAAATASSGNGACAAGSHAAAPAAEPPPPATSAPAASVAGSGSVVGGGASEVNTDVGDFELLDGGGSGWGEAAVLHPLSRRRARPPPLSSEEWAALFDAEGRLVGEATFRDRVCAGGCTPELRREVWKHLLGMYPRGSTAAQRAETAQRWKADYRALRQQWQSMVPAQEARCGSWRGHRSAVDKDVRRTDRGHPFFAREGGAGLRALRNVLLTHVVYDRDLGYCQGMSDLAAPLLVIMRDEAEAFWAFAALMERLGGNFGADLAGMSAQLGALRRLVQLVDPQLHAFFERRDCLSYYFAFRWLLILFKREFKFDEVLCLWECCWACRRTRHLHLYLAAAVLVHHRRVILSPVSPSGEGESGPGGGELDFDGMLRLCIGLAGRLELQPLLETAEALAGYAGEAGREVTAWLP